MEVLNPKFHEQYSCIRLTQCVIYLPYMVFEVSSTVYLKLGFFLRKEGSIKKCHDTPVFNLAI